MCKAITELIERGRNEGKIEGKIEFIVELLEELGQVPPRVMELVLTENNPDVLSRWLKSAAKADSMIEFETNM